MKIDLVNESDLPGNLKRSGATTPSLLLDFITILFYVIIALAVCLILISILLIVYSKDEIKEKLKSSYYKMKFNGIIRIITIGFLK